MAFYEPLDAIAMDAVKDIPKLREIGSSMLIEHVRRPSLTSSELED